MISRKFQRCLKSRRSRTPVKRKKEKSLQTKRRSHERAPGKLKRSIPALFLMLALKTNHPLTQHLEDFFFNSCHLTVGLFSDFTVDLD